MAGGSARWADEAARKRDSPQRVSSAQQYGGNTNRVTLPLQKEKKDDAIEIGLLVTAGASIPRCKGLNTVSRTKLLLVL